MKLSMNEATALSCQAMSLEQDILLCEKYGYDMIEPRTMDRMRDYLSEHSIEELAEFLKAHGIKPLAFNTLCFFNNRSEEGYRGILDELKQMCKWGQKIGCKTVITVPTVSLNKVTRSEIHKSAISCLKEMGKLAADYDMRVSVEFIGHPAASINTFGEAYEIIQAVDLDNVGITLDCFHFHGMDSKISDLAKADGRKIFIVHLNDTEDFPIGSLLDEDRLWPGTGCINLDEIFQTLKKIGWAQDVVSLELFRPEYYRMNPNDVYRIGKEHADAIIKRNFG